MGVQLSRLEGFFRVARARGYARAARSFPYPITQPAIHQQVKKLEAELGVRLFERLTKDQLALTPAGERLYAFAEPFFAELDLVVDEIRAEAFGGVLRIDTSGLVLKQLLPSFLRRLRSARRDILVDVEEVPEPDVARLRSGAAHLIVDYRERPPEGCEARQVAVSRPYLVYPAEHRGGEQALGQLAFVSYHPSLPHHALQLAAVRRHFGVPERTISASSVDAILAFVQAGLGFSVIPWLAERGPELDGVVAKPTQAETATFPIFALWRSGGRHPLVEAALAHLPAVRA